MSHQQRLDDLLDRLKKTRDELEAEIDRLLEGKRKQFSYTLQRGKVIFDRNVSKLQKKQRVGSLRYIFSAPWLTILTSPIIYGMLIPLALLDLTITIYQHICFRVYKVPRVVRSEYVVIDRHKLPYLNTIQKINCVYCGYGNGLIAYAREVIARTEQFWCPIKHAVRVKGLHDREQKFLDYGDAEAWRNELQKVRCDWEDPINEKPKGEQQ
ncbi:hypothetical protein [Pseudohongiella spirulinae]|uniref:Uncharacterized protein n=1 Tax=Pseudohongiella spirulinae TaxID=1249552 RepID=A0A0S2KH08_9GAMM|nr:hypothetical protein [Pseudohongiella spirulinae]ALO47529.1 hypothetical protein PS2015_2901 [Pseudohongiella spirulinae]